MGEINWSLPTDKLKVQLKPGYKYVIPKGNYPVGQFDSNLIVVWDGRNLNEVE
jgi:hypothetical protein